MKPAMSTFLQRISRNTAHKRQRGSIVVNTAIALSLIVIVLIGTELGYLFLMKREFQKTADLAALAGARRLGPSTLTDPCGAAKNDARTNAAINLPGVALTEIDCGHWEPGLPGEQHFAVTNVGMNALRVRINAEPPLKLIPSFGGNRFIQASAIATLGAPRAAFSVGTKLLAVDGSAPLGQTLKAIGLDLSNTALVGYDGLAQLKLTPGGLLKALGIGVAADIGVAELNTLLAGRKVTLGQILDATVTAVGQTTPINAKANLLNGLLAKLKVGTPSIQDSDLIVQLGSLTDPPTGLFARILAAEGDGASALKVDVNAFDLIAAAVGVATSKHALALQVPPLLGPLLGTAVTARVALIEPPSIGIGGLGATAYTGQLRTYVKLDTGSIPLIGNLVRLNLPIMIDAINGQGTITKMCTADLRTPAGVDRARIDVKASILKVCIGKPGADPAKENEIFSTAASCTDNLQADQLLRVSLPLMGDLIKLNAKMNTDALPLNGNVTLAASETGTLGNDLLLGTTIKSLTDGLLAALLGQSLVPTTPPTAAQRDEMANGLWGKPDCTSRACRQQRFKEVTDKIEAASNGLTGFVGNLTGNTLGILGNLVSLDIVGVLKNVGDLVGNLLNTLGNVLKGVLDLLTGNQCTGGGLFGGQGTDDGCRNEISNSLKGSVNSNGHAVPNVLTALAGFVLQLIQPLLDGLGKDVLTPLLRDTLGLNLGQVDVHLQSLDCKAQPMLVY